MRAEFLERIFDLMRLEQIEYVQIWWHYLPQYNSGSFDRLCDAARWRRLSIRAWDEELTLAEEAFVEQGRIDSA